MVEGTVWASDLTNQVAGVRLRVCIAGEYWCDDRWQTGLTTPYDRNKGAGYYRVDLWGARKDGSWFVEVVAANGNPLSERVPFQTTAGSGENDCQWVIIHFRKNY